MKNITIYLNKFKWIFYLALSLIFSTNLKSQIIDFNGIYNSHYNGSTSNYDSNLNSLEISNLNQGCNEGIHLELNRDINDILNEIDEMSFDLNMPEMNNTNQELELKLNHICQMSDENANFWANIKMVNSNEISIQKSGSANPFRLKYFQLGNEVDTPLDGEIELRIERIPDDPSILEKILESIRGEYDGGRYEFMFNWNISSSTSYNLKYYDNDSLLTFSDIDSLRITYLPPCTFRELISLDVTTCNISDFSISDGYVMYDTSNPLCVIQNQVCLDNGCQQFGGNCNMDCDCVALTTTVPTLSQWGLIILSLLILIIGSVSIRQQIQKDLSTL